MGEKSPRHPRQPEVLQAICVSKEGLTIAELAEGLGISKSAVSSAVYRLRETGKIVSYRKDKRTLYRTTGPLAAQPSTPQQPAPSTTATEKQVLDGVSSILAENRILRGELERIRSLCEKALS